MCHNTLPFGMLVVPEYIGFQIHDKRSYYIHCSFVHDPFMFLFSSPFNSTFGITWWIGTCWGYHVDGLQLINSLEVGPQKDLQTFVNTFSLKCSNVSSTFSTLVFDTPCHMPPPPPTSPPQKSWMTCTYLCLSNGINGNSLSLDDSKKYHIP